MDDNFLSHHGLHLLNDWLVIGRHPIPGPSKWSCQRHGKARSQSVLSVVVLCLLLIASPAAGQRTAQMCSINHSQTAANCSVKGLTIVPFGLHNNLRTLDLSGNYFPVLPHNSFLSYEYLKELYLRNNSLQELQEDSLRGINWLKVLDLTNNKLEEVPTSALAQVKGLEDLLLAGNKIYQVSNSFAKECEM